MRSTRLFGRFFVFLYEYVPDDVYLNIGITVSRKVGNAVKRNKSKRRIRSLIDFYIKTRNVDLKNGIRINIIARRLIVNQKFSNIQKDFFYGLNKILYESND